jgi:hypothetical protein
MKRALRWLLELSIVSVKNATPEDEPLTNRTWARYIKVEARDSESGFQICKCFIILIWEKT